MERKPLSDLGLRQREAMEVIYLLGEATVHEVRDRLSSSLAYTTVLSMLQKLEKCGWLRHKAKGRTYVYLPARPREQECQTSLQTLIDRVYGGDASRLLQQLITDRNLRAESRPTLRMFVDSLRSKQEKEN